MTKIFCCFQSLFYELFQRSSTKTSSMCNKPKYFHFSKSWILFQCSINKSLEQRFIHGTLWYYTLILHSDTTFWKASSMDSLGTSEKHQTDFYSNSIRKRFIRYNRYNILSIEQRDYLLNIASLFALDGWLVMHSWHYLAFHVRT